MFPQSVLLFCTDPKGFHMFASKVTNARTFVMGYGLFNNNYHIRICIREALSSIRVSRVAIVIEILTHFF